ncbi:hypothetical protein ACFYON_14465 [Micromonospora sp. NPDC005686]|uniref:hypothetical protein n=1 Tax=unclassified Micromonospora TaxID=2617518 RepID=UPI0033B8DE74
MAAVDLIAEQGFFQSRTVLFEELLRHGIGLLSADFRAAVDGLPPLDALGALVRLDVRTASSALFGVGLVVAVDWLLGIVRRVART